MENECHFSLLIELSARASDLQTELWNQASNYAMNLTYCTSRPLYPIFVHTNEVQFLNCFVSAYNYIVIARHLAANPPPFIPSEVALYTNAWHQGKLTTEGSDSLPYK